MTNAALSFVCVLCWCNALLGADAESSQAGELTKLQKAMTDLGREWNDALETQLPIDTDECLFQFFSQLQPVEMGRLAPFVGRNRKPWLVKSSTKWMKQVFRPEFDPGLANLEPKRLLLRQSPRPDLLYYEWTAHGYDLAMWESSSAVLVRLQRTGSKDLATSNAQEVNKLIDEIFVRDAEQIDREFPPLRRHHDGREDLYIRGERCDFKTVLTGHWQDSMVVAVDRKRLFVLGMKVGSAVIEVDGKLIRTGLPNVLVERNDQWLEHGLEKAK